MVRTRQPSLQLGSALLYDLRRVASEPLFLREGGELHRLHHLTLKLYALAHALCCVSADGAGGESGAVTADGLDAPSNSRYRLWTVHSWPSTMTVTMYSA